MGGSYQDLTPEDWKRLADRLRARDDALRVAFAAHVEANGLAWSNAVRCAFTGRPLPHMDDAYEPTRPWTLRNLTSIPRDGGDAIVFGMGYGSKHDGRLYLIGISDEAIDDLVAKGLAVKINDYERPDVERRAARAEGEGRDA